MVEAFLSEGTEIGECFFCKRKSGIYYGFVDIKINNKHSSVPLCYTCFHKGTKLRDNKIELQGFVLQC